MYFRFLALIIVSVVTLASAAPAQEPSGQEKLWAEIGKLSWQAGPAEGKIAGKASVTVPKTNAVEPWASNRLNAPSASAAIMTALTYRVLLRNCKLI